MYNFVLFKNVTEGESNRQGPHLICETKNKSFDIKRPVLFSSFFFFLFVPGVACSYRSVKWRACLQLAMHSVKALFVDDSSSSVALICWSACPLLFCTFSLFMCNVLKYLDYIQDMPFQCTLDVVYVFQSFI